MVLRGAKEALKYNQPLTAIGKLLLLRYSVSSEIKILLRKLLLDERTTIQLRNSQVPKELIDFIERLYQGELDINSLLQRSRKMYLQITNRRNG
ncbi:MAG: hypothetical protein AOA65_1157 [Candidatus Bathyarchaeota archaeon BA1]|nr:MAG: hypothetical protein AOA65_1157 [Candidatus Bathyarchaeota archaeon BA1]